MIGYSGKKRPNRRVFLGSASASAAVVTFDSLAPRVLCHAAAASPADERVLVVVEMAGGNDGLNTVVPHADPEYQKSRPKLAIHRSEALTVTESIGFHPSLRGLADLLEQGRFAVIQGVGYENPNRSHFESMDIWHSCRRKGQPREDGWIGRYLEAAGLADSTDPSALHLGAEKQPLALLSRSVQVPSIQSMDQFRLRAGESPDFRQAVRRLAASPRQVHNDLLDFVQTSTSSAIAASERMEAVGMQYKPSSTYPASGLGRKLETVAKLIASGLQSKVYYVRIDGFDTHANQPDAHAALLREVSEAVSTLVRDLEAHGDGDRLLVMCFSEFGRRVAENASDGTDHGTAGPILLAGSKVKAGLIGEHPSLADLDHGDLKYHTDFRRVYASVLEKWLGCSSRSVLGQEYTPLPILNSA